MIQKEQREFLLEGIIKESYKKGIVLRLSDLLNNLREITIGKVFGKPLSLPKLINGNDIIKAADLNKTFKDFDLDLNVLSNAVSKLERIYETTKVNVELSQNKVKEDILSIKNNINRSLDTELNRYKLVIGDSFNNTSKTDLSRTTAMLNTLTGEATLPLSTTLTTTVDPRNISMVSESITSQGFLDVFNNDRNKHWFVETKEYEVILNITSKSVVMGHDNEEQINSIYIEPTSDMVVEISTSIDSLNWELIGSKKIGSPHRFSFETRYALFIKLKLTNNSRYGIKYISINKLVTSSNAELISLRHDVPSGIHSFSFKSDQEQPLGTSLEHFYSISPDGPWVEIKDNIINIGNNNLTTLSFGSSATIFPDNENDANTLFYYSLPSSAVTPIESTATVKRGNNQFKINSYSYNYSAEGENLRIPSIEDWQEPPVSISKGVYMESLGNTTTHAYPATGQNSFLFTYSNSEQSWLGVMVSARNGTGYTQLLREKTSYKIETHVYSDRDITLNNLAAGVYVKHPDNNNTPSAPEYNFGIPWSLYINSTKVAQDNKYYSSAIPGSGTLLSTEGKSFSGSLKRGWNKITLLIYVPDYQYVDTNIKNGWNIMFLMRPNLFDLQFNVSDMQLQEYPIWADGRELKKVTEFYLKYNIKPRDTDYWAWRLSDNTPIAVLLRNDPRTHITLETIDGFYKGSYPNFTIEYKYNTTGYNHLYYRCLLKRVTNTLNQPRLLEYSFRIID